MDQYINNPTMISYPLRSENPPWDDEAKIINIAQRGNREAFNHLVISYRAKIFNLALRIMRDEDAAEEITQYTFVHAFINISSFRYGSFYGWLYRIATNACYDEYRRHKRHPMLSIENEVLYKEKLTPYDGNPLTENQPEIEAERHELELTIKSALNQLDPKQRTMIELIVQQEFDYRQTAQMLDIPVGTVKSRLSRARSHLHQILTASILDGLL